MKQEKAMNKVYVVTMVDLDLVSRTTTFKAKELRKVSKS